MSVAFRKGKRLILRPLEETDLPHLVRWMNDQDVTQYLTVYLPATMKDEREWLEGISKSKGSDIVLAIVTKENTFIGVVGLHQVNHRNQTALTGAWIGDSQYRNRGYGTEAKMLLLHYAFTELNLRKICSGAFAFNKRSQAYLHKQGYRIEGQFKKQIYRNGRFVDEIRLAVFKERFMKIWKKYKKKHL